ncbi:hypothetical protein [Nocardia aurea]|uniref:hypothetical protein n=1 Tax=Nocardia aurea TaxID=2144174 RepID=UPI003F4D6571
MTLRAGDVFAGFVIESVLGAGGMGVVYTARHPRMQRCADRGGEIFFGELQECTSVDEVEVLPGSVQHLFDQLDAWQDALALARGGSNPAWFCW